MKRSWHRDLLMRHLEGGGAPSIQALANVCDVTRQSASRNVQALLGAGLVVKCDKAIVLTDAGRQEVARSYERWCPTCGQALGGGSVGG